MRTIYLIPMPLIPEGNHNNISDEVKSALTKVDLIVTERARTTRRFIRQLVPDLNIEEKKIIEIEKSGHNKKEVLEELQHHHHIGIVSEAGCPGIADPGNFIVQHAYANGIKVVALSGPSSIFMALMASGFNGQQFTFHGYLPRDKKALGSKLKAMESELGRNNYTQIFMETPYRNTVLMETIFRTLKNETMLHISAGISDEKSLIKTQSIIQWKGEESLELHKVPSIFALGRYEAWLNHN